VLSAVKVILKNITLIHDMGVAVPVAKKLAPPLVTLLSAEPEIQYVALRCINLVIQKLPEVLEHEVRVFFCKYNDPIYVKIEKLEIMVQLAREETVDQVLLELKEYATEVDVDFVRRSVRAIGRCAIAIESAAERCVNVLIELIETRVSYVVQEAVIVIKDIFRRYPNRYESIISTLCENLDSLDEPEARASMVWVIGEYAERIDNADEILEQFLESFPEEPSMVQLQLMTAAVKLFLKKPSERPQQLIQLVLTYSTQETDDPDLRDRAFIYWRLLSADPDVAKKIVLAEKPVIEDRKRHLDPVLLGVLLEELGSLSSVFHKASASFVKKGRERVISEAELPSVRSVMDDGEAEAKDGHVVVAADGPSAVNSASAAPMPDLLGDLLDLSDPVDAVVQDAVLAPIDAPMDAPPADPLGDLLAGLDDLAVGTTASADGAAERAAERAADGAADRAPAVGEGPSARNEPPAPHPTPAKLLASKGGLEIRGHLVTQPALAYYLHLTNNSPTPIDGFFLTMNKNPRGFAVAAQKLDIDVLGAGEDTELMVPMVVVEAMKTGSTTALEASFTLQLAMKSNPTGVVYFSDSISV